jgi:hypothetical protein
MPHPLSPGVRGRQSARNRGQGPRKIAGCVSPLEVNRPGDMCGSERGNSTCQMSPDHAVVPVSAEAEGVAGGVEADPPVLAAVRWLKLFGSSIPRPVAHGPLEPQPRVGPPSCRITPAGAPMSPSRDRSPVRWSRLGVASYHLDDVDAGESGQEGRLVESAGVDWFGHCKWYEERFGCEADRALGGRTACPPAPAYRRELLRCRSRAIQRSGPERSGRLVASHAHRY